MASPVNTLTLIGNATHDPELRFTPAGTAVATFGLAINRRWQNRRTGEWEEAVSFFDIVCWGQLGENVAETVTRGTRLIVTGRLDQRSWETEAGEKRSKVEVVAQAIGPSLEFAIALVQKNERIPAGETPPPGAGPSPQPNTPAVTYDYEEEPF